METDGDRRRQNEDVGSYKAISVLTSVNGFEMKFKFMAKCATAGRHQASKSRSAAVEAQCADADTHHDGFHTQANQGLGKTPPKIFKLERYVS